MNRSFFKIAMAAFCILGTMGHAQASQAFGREPHTGQLPVGAHLAEGGLTTSPAAFAVFCNSYPDQCMSNGTSELLHLDTLRWQEMVDVNALVNRRIHPRPDAPGADVWELGVTSGDCDEFAVEKRRELLSRGWPSAALSLAVAYVANGQAHLVLTIRTDRGDFVLDNLRTGVLSSERTGYRWLMRQSTLHPRLWVRVNGTRDIDAQMAKLAKMPKKATPAAPAYPVGLAQTIAD